MADSLGFVDWAPLKFNILRIINYLISNIIAIINIYLVS